VGDAITCSWKYSHYYQHFNHPKCFHHKIGVHCWCSWSWHGKSQIYVLRVQSSINVNKQTFQSSTKLSRVHFISFTP
jgi:hypothetical protein